MSDNESNARHWILDEFYIFACVKEKTREAPKGFKNPFEPSYWHLPEVPSHNSSRRLRVRSSRLIRAEDGKRWVNFK